MKIAILGYGGQGRSAYEYWGADQHDITIHDADPQATVPEGAASRLGPDYLTGLAAYDLLVRTPALHPSEITKANPDTPDILSKVTTVTNEFMRVCPSRNIIGVTGTKGKGTTSTLLSQMLRAAGRTVHLGGNIGIPPLDMLKGDIKPEDWVVLELANFQLIDIRQSPHIGVCVMVAPEHLNWHQDMDEYISTKQQLFAHQAADDIAIYYDLNDYSRRIAGISPGVKIPYMAVPGALVQDGAVMIDGTKICAVGDINLIGAHNVQNVCAALTAAWQVTQDAAALGTAIREFRGLPHRLEVVTEKNGIMFYNDSFAATPEAAAAAIAAIPGKKVMILGGFDRNLDLGQIVWAIKAHQESIRKLLLIGQSAPRLGEALSSQLLNNFEIMEGKPTMAEIVDKAVSYAQEGDAVVLSPGFASFDMFKNFEERGLKFKDTVSRL